MGNTCFLNSALQCLTYTAPFTNYMLTQEHSRTCECLPQDVILVMQWFKKITNSSACVFLFPALHLFLPCQVLSQGSAWCAPWKTTSFTYLPTQGMLSSPSVCSVSSKVSKARVWKTLNYFFFFLDVLFGCLLHHFLQEKPCHWNPSVCAFTFLIHTEIAEHFQYGKQEDAHEFLRYILDAMQQCCLPENMWVIPYSEAEDICTITLRNFLNQRLYYID